MKTSSRLILAAAPLVAVSSAHAQAIVTWTTQAFNNTDLLSTQGSLVQAQTLGTAAAAITLNGINFTAATSVTNLNATGPVTFSAPAGTMTMYSSSTLYNGSSSVTGLTSGQANTLFQNAMYVSGANNNGLTLNGLTDGQQYLFEFLTVDDRVANDTISVGYDATKTLTGISISGPTLISGSFTASGTTQTLLIADANGGNVTFEAYQLRAVPEPSTYGLIGAAALAFAATVRRRRKLVGKAA